MTNMKLELLRYLEKEIEIRKSKHRTEMNELQHRIIEIRACCDHKYADGKSAADAPPEAQTQICRICGRVIRES